MRPQITTKIQKQDEEVDHVDYLVKLANEDPLRLFVWVVLYAVVNWTVYWFNPSLGTKVLANTVTLAICVIGRLLGSYFSRKIDNPGKKEE